MISRPNISSQYRQILYVIQSDGKHIQRSNKENRVDLWEYNDIIMTAQADSLWTALKGPDFKVSCPNGAAIVFEYGSTQSLTNLYDSLFGEW
jgi:hypothetical protein